MTTLLVTSVGSGVATAISEAAAVNARRIRLVGATTDCAAAEGSGFDRLVLVPPTAEQRGFARALLALAREEAPCFVLAGRDADLCVLGLLRHDLARVGASWTGPVGMMSRRAHDKVWVSRTLRAAGLPAAETVAGRDAARRLARTHGYPLVVKPRHGSGSRGVITAQDDRQLLDALSDSDQARVVQPYLWPVGQPRHQPLEQVDELSGQAIVTSEGLAGPFWTRNVLRGGRPVEALVVSRPALDSLIAAVAEALRPHGLLGPLNVQCRETSSDVFEIFELNCRCTGLTGARAKMGFHELDVITRVIDVDHARAERPWSEGVARLSGRHYVVLGPATGAQ